MAKRGRPSKKNNDSIEKTDLTKMNEDSGLFIANPLYGNENVTKMINQLKASADQYKIQTKKEEREMINKYRYSDPDKLKQLLIMHNLKLVMNLAKKYFKKTQNFDDMVFRGINGLAIAADRFDLDKNIKFCTYAYMWIFKYITQEFYDPNVNMSQTMLSMDAPIGNDDGDNDSSLDNIITNHIDTSITNQSIHSIESELSSNEMVDIVGNIRSYVKNDPKFEKTDYEIFSRLMENGQSVKDASVEMNLSSQYINKRKRIILNNVKDMLKDKYHIESFQDLAFG